MRASLANLTAELQRRQAVEARTRWCPHQPHQKQRTFLACDELEALYGGAAGGGKSDALLMAALQHVDTPGYSAIVFRRTFQDLALPGAIMDRAAEWLGDTSAHWNGDVKRWTFPSGATLVFGYLDTERDKNRYKSAEFQFIGFDELTQFPEGWYRFLFSRLRRLRGSELPLRMRAATNPGDIGHEWVKRRWAIPDPVDFERVYRVGRRAFVPAKLEDNPSLDRAEYERALDELDHATREQMRFGRWVRDAGGLVYRYTEDNDIPSLPALTHKILGIDYGYSDECAFAVLGWKDHDPRVYVAESFKREHCTPSDAAVVTQELQARHVLEAIVGDTGGLGKGYAEEARRRFHIPIEPADKANKRGFISLLNGELEHAHLLIGPGNEELVAEMAELPWDRNHIAEAPGFANHLCDATLYAWRRARAFVERPAPPPKTHEQIEDEQIERMLADEGVPFWDRE